MTKIFIGKDWVRIKFNKNRSITIKGLGEKRMNEYRKLRDRQ